MVPHHSKAVLSLTDALENHIGTVCFGGRTIINLRFAADIDITAGDELPGETPGQNLYRL